MLNGLRRGPKAPASIDPIDWLQDCHGRIRQFTAIGLRLAEAEGAPDEEVREAAERLVRYFTIALPLHSEDEERSLAPRLLAKSLPPEVEKAVVGMQREHGPIHALIDELVPHWRKLMDEPSNLAEIAPTLRPLSGRLKEIFDPHLAIEERLVFAVAKERLDPGEVAEIADEMRARRQGSHGF